MEADSLFKNSTSGEFAFRKESPAVDGANFLAQIFAAVSGTSLHVLDTRYFYDIAKKADCSTHTRFLLKKNIERR